MHFSVFILIHHSFDFPDVILEMDQLTPLTPLGSVPDKKLEVIAVYVDDLLLIAKTLEA